MAAVWQRCEDCADGEDAVHKAAEKYLPRLPAQLNIDYASYVARANFYNAFYRTVAGLVGMLFRKPPAIDVPASVEPMLDDITMSGIPFHMFMEDVCEETLKTGRIGVLVDYPMVENIDQMTQADAAIMQLRPTMKSYDAKNIINWEVELINNVSTLSMVVLKVCEEIEKDEFTFTEEERYRVLDLDEATGNYRVRMFKMDGDVQIQLGGDVYPLMNNKPLKFIPFIFLGTDDVTPDVDEPPLIDLVNMNLAHYRVTADYENGCHITGLAQAWITGYTDQTAVDGKPEKIYYGGPSAWVFPSELTKVGILGLNSDFVALTKNLDRKEQQMAILGARMLEPQRRGVEAPETAAIHRKGEESMLSAMAQSVSLGMTRALQWFSDWAGATGDVSVDINRDFYPAPMTPQLLAALIAGWQAGAYSDQVLFDQLQQAEMIPLDTTIEEEQARIASKAPQMIAPPVAIGANANATGGMHGGFANGTTGP